VIDAVTIAAAAIALVSIFASVLIALRGRNNSSASQDRILWWLPLSLVLGAAVLLLSLMIRSSDAPLLYILFIAPVVCFACFLWLLAAAIRKKPRQCLSVLLAVIGFVGISWSLDRSEDTLRPFLRWLFWSRQYKAELMTQPEPVSGELKHFVWDTWGFVPSGFNVTYLVFDPADSLANAAKSKMPRRFGGIPCEVPSVFRLEKQWYAVRFYTDEDWRNCPSTVPRVQRE
jgi:hypothetical protein